MSSQKLDKTTPTTIPLDKEEPEIAPSAEQLSQAAAPQVTTDVMALANAIVAATQASKGRVIVPFGQQSHKNVFNPTGKKGRKLHKACFQNGFRLGTPDPDIQLNLTDEEIELLKHVRPGHYLEGLISVREIDTADGGELHINYKNRTADQRMAIGTKVGSFAGMLKICIKEYDEQQDVLRAQRRKDVEEALA